MKLKKYYTLKSIFSETANNHHIYHFFSKRESNKQT
jgi:hypothetical protein